MPYRSFRLSSLPFAPAFLLLLAGALSARAQEPSGIRIWFAAPADTFQIVYTRGPTFLIVVETDAADSGQADTLEANLTTGQGDHEVLKAIETGPATGTYVLEAVLQGTHGYLAMYNGVVELDRDDMPGATLDLEVAVHRGGVTETANLELGLPAGDALRKPARAAPGEGRPSRPGAGYSVDGRRIDPGAGFRRGLWFRP